MENDQIIFKTIWCDIGSRRTNGYIWLETESVQRLLENWIVWSLSDVNFDEENSLNHNDIRFWRAETCFSQLRWLILVRWPLKMSNYRINSKFSLQFPFGLIEVEVLQLLKKAINIRLSIVMKICVCTFQPIKWDVSLIFEFVQKVNKILKIVNVVFIDVNLNHYRRKRWQFDKQLWKSEQLEHVDRIER